MKKVSVIVASYNSKDTVARCLTSLVNQTLQDIEIIAVNDASTDDSLTILKEFETQYPDKVKVIDSPENEKAGGARNRGFDVATGEYIGIVDADDYVASSMYERLYNRAKETDADIVDSGFYMESIDKAMLYASDDLTGLLDDHKKSELISRGGYLCTKIFRNELFNDPQIRMRANTIALEDFEILIYMILRAQRLETVKEIFYYYCNTQGSSTKVMDFDKYYNSVCSAIRATYDICHELPAYDGAREVVEYMMARIYSFGVNRCLYDHIAKYGPDISRVRKYFDDATPKEKEYLVKLAGLEKEVAHVKFHENQMVKQRMNPLDLEIIKECSKRY